jgi:hypothetical protein
MIYSYTNTRRLAAMIESSEEENKHNRLIRYYSKLLKDPTAYAKFKADAARSHNRRLQSGDILEMQEVTIDSCLFEFNAIGPDSQLTIDGVIELASPSNRLIVKNSMFRNNDFSAPVNGVSLIHCYYLIESH